MPPRKPLPPPDPRSAPTTIGDAIAVLDRMREECDDFAAQYATGGNTGTAAAAFVLHALANALRGASSALRARHDLHSSASAPGADSTPKG